MKSVKVAYNADTLETTITVDGKAFDTSRIDGKEIEIWAYPFMMRKIKWNGFYDEMTEALGEKEFNLIFEGSESGLNELKEAWEDAPVHIVEENFDMPDAVIEYDEENLTTTITVNGDEFDVSRINGKEIEDWVYPFIIRKVKWDGIFEELAKVIGSEEYTIAFLGDEKYLSVLNEECPETVMIKMNTETKFLRNESDETIERDILLSKLCIVLTKRSSSLKKDPDYLYNEAKKCNKKEQAFALYKKSADLGNVKAQFETGKYYYEVYKSYDNAFEYFRKASSYSHAEAQYYIGEIYYNGYGRKQSYMSAIKWYKLSVEHGFDDAIYKVGLSYLKVNDLKSAKEWLEKAVKAGCSDAKAELKKVEEATRPKSAEELYNEAKVFDEQHRYNKSFDLYKKSAEMGYTKSMFEMGKCYYFGAGIGENYQKAFEYFKKAADKNNSEAQYYLGSLYYNGDGVKQNYSEAVKWYTKGANNRDPDAMNMLGVCYHDGKGIKKNLQQAVTWYRKAADKGHDAAQYNLAECYWNGEGTKQNKALAFSLYEKAAEQGHASANNALGLRYHLGEGRKVDIQKAIMYYQKAAETGLSVAMCNLGILYKENNDIDLAREWFEKALEAGDENAQEYLDKIDEDNEYDDSTEYDEDFDEYDEADYSNDIDIPESLEITYNMKEHEDFYIPYNSKYFNPYGSDADKNFIYSLFFYIDVNSGNKIIEILKDADNYARTGNTRYDSVPDCFNDLTEYYNLDSSEETEEARTKNAKTITVMLFDYFNSNILEKILKSIYDYVNNMNSDKYNEALLVLRPINERLNILIDEIKGDIRTNKNKVFSYFDEAGGSIYKVMHYAIELAESEYANNYENYEAEFKSADIKATATAFGGGALFGLLSFIPTVSDGIGNASNKFYEKSEKMFETMKLTYQKRFKDIIYFSAIVLALENMSDIGNKWIIDDYDYDEDDNFFSKI